MVIYFFFFLGGGLTKREGPVYKKWLNGVFNRLFFKRTTKKQKQVKNNKEEGI